MEWATQMIGPFTHDESVRYTDVVEETTCHNLVVRCLELTIPVHHDLGLGP